VIRVGVAGAAGRMGLTVCEAVEGADDMELCGRVDPALGVALADILGDCDVVVDFTTPDAALDNALACVRAGVHAVIGTTGWDPSPLREVSGANVFVAPNFAIGAVLMMAFASKAAQFYESVEVIELHHPDKVDAPSGTAARTAELIATARDRAGLTDVPDATTSDPDGARGARAHGIPVHSVRLRGLVAHQEVLFGQTGEMLTIRHDSFDRVSFMPGVVAAVRAVHEHPGLTVGLEHYLGI
jgi:4-hydroxy-tetrahydrodipicolinate reductase